MAFIRPILGALGDAIMWLDAHEGALTFVATAFIGVFTWVIACVNRRQLRHARRVDRAYVTGGGDIWTDEKTGKQYFRLDIENHGQTPAFVRAYDVRFAKLTDLQDEFPTVRNVKKRPLVDGVSPQGGRRKIFTKIEREKLSDDAVFGAVWYEDVWGDEHPSRFILRIAETNDIKGEGLTRLDVRGVGKDYSDWDYPKKKQKGK